MVCRFKLEETEVKLTKYKIHIGTHGYLFFRVGVGWGGCGVGMLGGEESQVLGQNIIMTMTLMFLLHI